MRARRAGFAALTAWGLTMFACSSPAPVKTGAPRTTRVESNQPIVSAASPDNGGASTLYRKAGQLYSMGRYELAVKHYLEFIKTARRDSRLVDNAYFRIGVSWYRMARYRDALRFFTIVVSKYKGSEVYTEAMINSGVCQYHLNNIKQAQNLFGRARARITSPGHNAYIFYYQAKIADDGARFDKAVDLYIDAEAIAENELLVTASRTRVERIMHNFFGEKSLIRITKERRKSWAAKIAFQELVNMYARAGDERLLGAANNELRQQFPPAKKTPTKVFGFPLEMEEYVSANPKIGVTLPLSGSGAKAGREILQGIQLAFNTFREMIDEKHIKPIIKDSASDTATAEKVLKQFGDDRDTIAVIGPAFSSAFRNAAAIADDYNLPIFSPSATDEGIAGLSDHLFRNAMTSRIEAERIGDLAFNTMGLKRFAIIFPDNKYGREISSFFIQKVESLGGQVVTAQSYETDQTDFGPQVRGIGGFSDDQLRKQVLSVARSNPTASPEGVNYILADKYEGMLSIPFIESHGSPPLTRKNFRPALSINYDAVFIPGMYNKVGLILPELEFYNIKGIKVFASKEAHNPGLLSIADKYTEGVIFADGFFKKSRSPHVKAFVRNYRLAFREEPTILSAQAYDVARIILSAIAHGADSRKSMTAYLGNLRFFEGVSGITSIGQSGDAVRKINFLTMKNGKIVEYNPDDGNIPADIDQSRGSARQE